ncbi:MAG: type I DNA topoisomerase [Chloroflexi bacterium]|nr:type I DNA topoisomerase [Chloroflexota bacterium]
MAKNLVVVESPAKARTVGRFLGDSYQVIASMGHVRDLPSSVMGVDVEDDFAPAYEVVDNKKKVMTELRSASKDAENIYQATDPDREGEAISWHLVEAAGWKRKHPQRVVFHEITQAAIQEAFQHPRDIDMKLVNAQQARRILDRLVGYELSPLLWKKVSGGRKMGLSAGRVQSIALRLVVEREQEIEAFKAQEYWSIEALLQPHRPPKGGKAVQYTAKLVGFAGDKKGLDLPDQQTSEQVLAALKDAAYVVAGVEKREVRARPAAPFTTSTLQQEAWRKLRFPARKTMQIAQQLYEGLPLGPEDAVGLITYMRTDSTTVSSQALQETIAYVRQKFGAEYAPKSPRVYTRKAKNAQEAHEAIRPTSVAREPDAIRRHLNTDQFRLYDLVWKRMVASQMADAISDSTRVDINAKGPNTGAKACLFRATGSVLKFPGFRTLYLEDRDDSSDDDDQQRALPTLETGDPQDCMGITPEQHFTQPPPRYNDATLVRALEEQGIGRPSTYAPILSIIQDRQYVTKEQGRFQPTELGKVVARQLISYFPSVIDVGFTATMEEDLDEIAQGDKEWVPVLREFYGPFQKALSEAAEAMPRVKVEEPSNETCELCGKPMVIKTSRFGRFLACSGFPECRGKKSLQKKTTGVTCPECKEGVLMERKGRGRTFYGCSRYPNCKYALNQRPLPTPCPECGGLMVASGRENARCTACGIRQPLAEPATEAQAESDAATSDAEV